jgi:hypothetical protein
VAPSEPERVVTAPDSTAGCVFSVEAIGVSGGEVWRKSRPYTRTAAEQTSRMKEISALRNGYFIGLLKGGNEHVPFSSAVYVVIMSLKEMPPTLRTPSGRLT